MNQNDVTSRLLRELWVRFGTAEHPAEWDGNTYGGGKLSQRYWEYFKGIQMLELDENAVVLDIGGGSPQTGLGFFSSLIATAAKKVIVMDPNIGTRHRIPDNVEALRELSDFESLKTTFKEHPEITHVSCISVFEHVPADVRSGIMRAINEYFPGSRFVLTLEYHPIHRFFEHQLTARTLSELVSPLRSFYPVSMEASPVLSEDAFFPSAKNRPDLKRRLLRMIWPRGFTAFVPRWYPLAIAFTKAFQAFEVRRAFHARQWNHFRAYEHSQVVFSRKSLRLSAFYLRMWRDPGRQGGHAVTAGIGLGELLRAHMKALAMRGPYRRNY